MTQFIGRMNLHLDYLDFSIIFTVKEVLELSSFELDLYILIIFIFLYSELSYLFSYFMSAE